MLGIIWKNKLTLAEVLTAASFSLDALINISNNNQSMKYKKP